MSSVLLKMISKSRPFLEPSVFLLSASLCIHLVSILSISIMVMLFLSELFAAVRVVCDLFLQPFLLTHDRTWTSSWSLTIHWINLWIFLWMLFLTSILQHVLLFHSLVSPASCCPSELVMLLVTTAVISQPIFQSEVWISMEIQSVKLSLMKYADAIIIHRQ